MTEDRTFLDFKQAQKLVHKEHSCAQVVHTRKHVALSPKYIGQISTGIKEHLDSELKFYSQALDGIPIAYSNKFTFAQSAGAIMDDCPYIHFVVVVDCVVFQPKIGSLLSGCVNKLGQDHVGCLVHGLFNASILRPRHISYQEWEGSKLNGGDEFVFEVTKLSKQSGLLSITGKFTSNSLLQKKAKRKRTESDRTEPSANTRVTEPEVETVTKHKRKKHKHSKSLSADFSETDLQKRSSEKDRLSVGSEDSGIGVNTSECELSKKSKKKKRKRDKERKVSSNCSLEGNKTEHSQEAFNVDSCNNDMTNSERVRCDSEQKLQKKKEKHKKHKKDNIDL